MKYLCNHDAQYCDSSLKLNVLNTRLVSPNANNDLTCLSLFSSILHNIKKHGPILLIVPAAGIAMDESNCCVLFLVFANKKMISIERKLAFPYGCPLLKFHESDL